MTEYNGVGRSRTDLSATERLRAMLDERGIEHDDNDANVEVTGVRITRWKNGGKRDVRYEEWRNGTTRLDAGNVSPEQAIAATVREHRSCASCPEIENPDSYISHLQSALRWHDEHVPRPTNPKAKCIVLQGRSVPEEVLFVREGGGVTHYLPEDATVGVGTCKLLDNRRGPDMHCSACGGEVDDEYRYFMDSHGYSRCPHCGARIEGYE